VSPGRTTTLSVRAFERGDAATPYVRLPAVEWDDGSDRAGGLPASR